MDIKNDFVLDLENIFKFCFDSNDKNNDSEITKLYVSDDDTKNLVLASKQLKEVKDSNASGKQNIKYDFVKTLVSYLFDIDGDDITFGDSVVINTLMSEGFLK